eukprot:3275167-Rhodomonas_salina.1
MNLTNAVCTVCCYAGPIAYARTPTRRSYEIHLTFTFHLMVWHKQGATPIVYAYKYRSLCDPYLNTNTPPNHSTIHLAEEWT